MSQPADASNPAPSAPDTGSVPALLAEADAHRRAGRNAEAERLCRQVLQLAPDQPDALHLLGLTLVQAGNARLAIPLVERALAARPDAAQFQRTLGMALYQCGEFAAAIARLESALGAMPGDFSTHLHLGFALHSSGRIEEAGETLERALALNRDLPEAHFYVAISLLCRGEFERGWREYEARPSRVDYERQGLFKRFREWRGENPAGATVLLYSEQGYGDTIQFARYVPLLAARGARPVLRALPELVHLMSTLPGVAQVSIAGEPPPAADYVCLLGSLPGLFGTRLDTIPATVPYLQAPQGYLEFWRERLGARSGFRVGLVWAGNPSHSNDANRSLPLAALEPLAEVPGVTLYSLQKGAATSQAGDSGLALTPLGDELFDFADTAGALAQMDLVVTVDTSVAHLAGATGVPVWLLLPTGPDWRWLAGREDSPWYPTMRIFRQHAPGDWTAVVARVAAALTERAAASRSAPAAHGTHGGARL